MYRDLIILLYVSL
ncbi:hypothetical protein F383_30416 [Gossypium arboreum]|uniref:Uncharacterized protein n=1 Tax=Gossypium arboreum TaxID=29729 RepID=A0A0B0MU94_GOSAR|nr:hypothetical protein F383_30416 [Gossypium arboreum]